MRDGLHRIKGYDVYVVDGVIKKGIRKVDEYHTALAQVIRKCGRDSWAETGDITVEAFRAGVRRGTIEMI